MTTDSGTQLLCLIGDPVEHSLSPAMHSAVFEKLGLDCFYMVLKVEREWLEVAVKGLESIDCLGFNVTIPHKVAILNYLDEVSEEASTIGAVNTVKNEGGKLKGFNTDGSGAIKALEERTKIQGKSVLLLGAGGSARAISFSLALNGVGRLTIANRTPEKAESLASEVKEKTGMDADFCPLGKEDIERTIGESDILINATSVGLHPETDNTPVPSDLLHPGLVVMDIVYNPLETRLLREAKSAGAETIDGAAMLVHQGAESLKIWLDIDAPIEVMQKLSWGCLKDEGRDNRRHRGVRQALREVLQGRRPRGRDNRQGREEGHKGGRQHRGRIFI